MIFMLITITRKEDKRVKGHVIRSLTILLQDVGGSPGSTVYDLHKISISLLRV